MKHNLKKDPKPGSVLRLPTWDLNGKRLEWDAINEVLFVGDCNSCIRDKVERYIRYRPASASKLVLVVRMNLQEAKLIRKSIGDKVSIVLDSDGELHRQWNAFFTPRWYVVSAQGKLIQKMERPGALRAGCCGGNGTK